MSGHIKPDLIAAVAESVGIEKLSPEAARILAPDIEYRLRDVVQVCLVFGTCRTLVSHLHGPVCETP